MPAPIVTPGDDITLTAYLFDNGAEAVLTGATITAAIQDGRGRQLVAATAQSSGTSGASWGTGVIVCVFPRTITAGLSRGDAFLEIESILSGTKRTWPLMPIQVQQGSIA